MVNLPVVVTTLDILRFNPLSFSLKNERVPPDLNLKIKRGPAIFSCQIHLSEIAVSIWTKNEKPAISCFWLIWVLNASKNRPILAGLIYQCLYCFATTLLLQMCRSRLIGLKISRDPLKWKGCLFLENRAHFTF